MIQNIIKNYMVGGDDGARFFAQQHFDTEFNEKILDYLIDEYYVEWGIAFDRKENVYDRNMSKEEKNKFGEKAAEIQLRRLEGVKRLNALIERLAAAEKSWNK